MSKKTKYCPECGKESRENSKFCDGCGYKLIIDEVVEDKEGHIRKAEEIIESESPIEIPKKLTLMPGEKLLERHLEFYVSNKRLIRHIPSLFKMTTTDYHYRHIKGMQEDNRRPFLGAGLIIGIILLIIGAVMTSETEAGLFILILGVIFVILAFWYKKVDLVVMHMDGGSIKVPNIKSASGKKVAAVLRNQLYNN